MVGTNKEHINTPTFLTTIVNAGADLTAFILTVRILAKGDSPDYIPCSTTGPCIPYDPCAPDGGRFDRRNPEIFCGCCDG